MSVDRVRALIASHLPEIVAIRHDLHRHPEIAYKEHRTSQVVQRELGKLNIACKAGLAGGTGVVAHLPATASNATSPAKAVGLRADMDALPIAEQTGVPYASTHPGFMHACGHDGHTAILLGVARVLSQLPRPRPVTLVFQPAEEGGGGGDKLCKEGLTEGGIIGPPIDRMFGLHGWPELPLGHVGSRPGPLLASTDEMTVVITGVQSHAAYPHYSRDAMLTAAQCIVNLQSVVSRNISPLDSCVISVCLISGGTAVNIIPETVKFSATLRCLKQSTRALAKRRATELVQGIAASMGCTADVNWEDGYPVTHNDPALTEAWFKHADELLGAEKVLRVENPTMGGEDFAFYAQKVPSVFFCLGLKRLGQERYATLHQPDFDFNDDAIPTGIEMFVKLATSAN
jgi:amidohydrolase